MWTAAQQQYTTADSSQYTQQQYAAAAYQQYYNQYAATAAQQQQYTSTPAATSQYYGGGAATTTAAAPQYFGSGFYPQQNQYLAAAQQQQMPAELGDSRGVLRMNWSSRMQCFSGSGNGTRGHWDCTGVRRLVGEWENQFKRKPANSRFYIEQLDMSFNSIGDHGVEAIFRFLKQFKVQVKVIKMFKNTFGDHGAYYIADYLKALDKPVTELHLSDNYITEKGFRDVMTAVSTNLAYPIQAEEQRVLWITPMWVRMDNNCVRNFGTFFPALNEELTMYRKEVQPEFSPSLETHSVEGVLRNFADKDASKNTNYKGYRVAKEGPTGYSSRNFPAAHVIFGQRQRLTDRIPATANRGRPRDAPKNLYDGATGIMMPDEEPTSRTTLPPPAQTSSKTSSVNPAQTNTVKQIVSTGSLTKQPGIAVIASKGQVNQRDAQMRARSRSPRGATNGLANGSSKTTSKGKGKAAAAPVKKPPPAPVVPTLTEVVESGGVPDLLATGEDIEPLDVGMDMEALMNGEADEDGGGMYGSMGNLLPGQKDITELIKEHNQLRQTMGLEELPAKWMYIRDEGNSRKIFYFDIENNVRTLERSDVFPEEY
ncbi:unnamed protein product [Amoebophrya sp. A25]|nr:unnamed protein product [Amoebophrya sp. A25]|eukprot:GSA25T00000803001.1